MSQERTGVLLLRVWVDDTERRLRARITHVLDITTSDERVVVAGSVEEIERAVRDWLTEFSLPVTILTSGDGALTDR